MDRRQLLFGAASLGLVTNLNRNHLLNAQVGKATVDRRPSDRERAGLRGSVKTCSEFIGDETESIRETGYAADGPSTNPTVAGRYHRHSRETKQSTCQQRVREQVMRIASCYVTPHESAPRAPNSHLTSLKCRSESNRT